MNKIITGIGSRACPQEVLDKFFKLGVYFANKGYTLRSGAAEGSDSSFERAFDSVNGKKEIYLPWANFNNNNSPLFNIPIGAFLIAKSIHPKWNDLKQGAQKLHARNIGQLLSFDLNTPSDFVVCYTENGEEKGGTATCIRLAKQLNIPVFNFGGNGEEELKEYWNKGK